MRGASNPDCDPLRILLVEDSEGHADLIALALATGPEKVDLVRARSIAEARERLAETPPDLMIVDYRLPDGRGLDLLPGIGNEPALPILLLTSHGTEEVAKESLRAGAIDYLVKSSALFEEMPHLVNRAMREWRLLQEKQNLSQRLRDAEKLQAIGQLAGGIAHDFNNQLAIMQGFGELLMLKLPPDSQQSTYCRNILTACQSSKVLTQQLLAFARRGNYQRVTVNLRQLLEAVVSTVESAAPEGVKFEQSCGESTPLTTGDPGQFSDLFHSILTNSVEAMDHGGTVKVQTDVIDLEKADMNATALDLPAGRYVETRVIDDGRGMDEAIVSRVFEPFFSTKQTGRGRGLGLAAAYGIVSSHGGAIEVTSEPGQGTEVRVLLPLLELETLPPPLPKAESPHGKGLRVLLIDDEPGICEVAVAMFEAMGHTTRVCHEGAAAIQWFTEHRDDVDLVVLDMIMPRMSGAETFAKLREISPDVRVLLSTGYSQSEDVQKTLRGGAIGVLQKPYLMKDLSDALDNLTSPD